MLIIRSLSRCREPTSHARPITAPPETLTLGLLNGIKRLRAEHVELIHGNQLRAADRLLSLYSVLVAISVVLVALRFSSQVSPWLFGL
jgi:hypothetical protein